MSRVEDAVRRAAAQPNDTGVASVSALLPTEALDAAVLAEQFYGELPPNDGDPAPAGDPTSGPTRTVEPRPPHPAATSGALIPAPAPRTDPPPPADSVVVLPTSRGAAAPALDGAAERSRGIVSSAGGPAASTSSLFERMTADVAEKVVIDKALQASSREQYRRLAATLHHGQLTHGLRVIVVTSALPGEGKTLTAANLAMTLSESYRRNVLLIDADLRRPTQHTVFNIDNSTGLAEGLAAIEERPMPLRQLSRHLSVLPAGRPSSDPMAALISERFRRVIAEGRETFDWVIIDTPPVALLTDSKLMVSVADGALLVVRAEKTPYNLVKRASEALGHERILGVILNSALIGPRGTGTSSYGGSYYYGDSTYYGPRKPRLSFAQRLLSRLPGRRKAAGADGAAAADSEAAGVETEMP